MPPLLDEHAVDIDAPPAAVWAALLDWHRSFDRAPVRTIARLLGCVDPTGFHVSEAVPESTLGLAGRHRFADYELTFRLDGVGGGARDGAGRTRLTAESRSDFPGMAGRAYQTMLLGTGGHVLAVRRMLADVRRRAA